MIENIKSKIIYPYNRKTTIDNNVCPNCPNCGYENLVFDEVRGEYVCPRCGTVVSERFVVVEQPEYRVFDFDDKSIAKMHYAVTFIPGSVSDNVELSRRITKTYNPLERVCLVLARYCITYGKLHGYPMYAIKTAIMYATSTYRGYIFRKIDTKYKPSIETMAKSSLYVAALMHGLVNHAEEILKTVRRRRSFWRAVRYVFKCNNVKINFDVNVINLICEYATRLKLRRETINFAVELYRRSRYLFSGMKSRTIAATCIYVAASLVEGVQQKTVKNVAGISDVSLRRAYKKLLEKASVVVYV